MACFEKSSSRFAIERAWETLYEMRPVFKHPADVIIGKGQKVREEFAALVKNTLHTRDILDDVLTPHRWKERKLTDNEDFTYLSLCEKRKQECILWFLDYCSQPMHVEETNLDREVGVSVPVYTNIRQFKPITGDLESRLRAAIAEELHMMIVWDEKNASEAERHYVFSNKRRVEVYTESARQTIGPWIQKCSTESMKLQVFVMIVLYMAAKARLEKAKELQSRRKKPPEWIVSRLIASAKKSEHKLDTIASFVSKNITILTF